jgi:hypothetical protein
MAVFQSHARNFGSCADIVHNGHDQSRKSSYHSATCTKFTHEPKFFRPVQVRQQFSTASGSERASQHRRTAQAPLATARGTEIDLCKCASSSVPPAGASGLPSIGGPPKPRSLPLAVLRSTCASAPAVQYRQRERADFPASADRPSPAGSRWLPLAVLRSTCASAPAVQYRQRERADFPASADRPSPARGTEKARPL